MDNSLTSLLSLLTGAITEFSSLYESNKVPLPSLDHPSVTSDDFLLNSPECLKESKLIVAVCDQISNLVQLPEDNLRHASLRFADSTCVQTAIKANVAEILREHGGEQGLHIERIAAYSGADARNLARVLRYLCTYHIFRETSPDVFANNRNSAALDTLTPVAEITDPDRKFKAGSEIPAYCMSVVDTIMPAATHVSKSICRPEEGQSAPFSKSIGTGETIFDWFHKSENDDARKRFAVSMGVEKKEVARALSTGFPWHELSEGARVVDVGGGMGYPTMVLAQAHPHLRYTIQDLSETLEVSKQYFAEEAPDLLKSGAITHQVHNFFEEQPVKGADVYFLRAVIHDWTDKDAVHILSKLREAASQTSKLVCVDRIIDYSCPVGAMPVFDIPGSHGDYAPAPLLSNWGAGAWNLYHMDMIMMCYFLDAAERTIVQWKDLFQEAGWKLSRVYRGHLSQCIGEPI